MTNYNERLDELMPCDCKLLKGFAWRNGDPCEGCINGMLKQATTSLFKELVAEAKPMVTSVNVIETYLQNGMTQKAAEHHGRNHAIKQFEQNLLKALEKK